MEHQYATLLLTFHYFTCISLFWPFGYGHLTQCAFSEPVSNRCKFLIRIRFFLSNKPAFTTNYSQNMRNPPKAGFHDFINGTPTCVIFSIFSPDNCTHYLPWNFFKWPWKTKTKKSYPLFSTRPQSFEYWSFQIDVSYLVKLQIVT